jgi:hypothetical protein
MDDDDLVLRNLTYARFVELGRAPTAAEVAAVGSRDEAAVMAGWERRLSADWRPHTRDGNQAILDGLGLAGPFWRLPGS